MLYTMMYNVSLKHMANKIAMLFVPKIASRNPLSPHQARSETLPLVHDFEILLNSDILDA